MADMIANVLYSEFFKDENNVDEYMSPIPGTSQMEFDFDKIIRTPEDLDISLKGGVMSETRRWVKSISSTLIGAESEAADFIAANTGTGFYTGKRGGCDNADRICRGLDWLRQLANLYENADAANIDLGLRYYRNIAKYGYESAVDWRRANWGCKWNASNTICYKDSGIIVFQTPNSPPVEVISRLALDNLGYAFYLIYADEDFSYGGTTVFKGADKLECDDYAPLVTCWIPYLSKEDFPNRIDDIIGDLQEGEGID